MATLYVKSPNGTTKSINLDTMNQTESGDSLEWPTHWWRLTNGLTFETTSITFPKGTLTANVTFPIAAYNFCIFANMQTQEDVGFLSVTGLNYSVNIKICKALTTAATTRCLLVGMTY